MKQGFGSSTKQLVFYLTPIKKVKKVKFPEPFSMRNTFLMKNATGGKIHRGELQNIYLTHRLDSPTSGIMAACEDYQVSVHLKKLFKERLVKKTYYALVRPRGRIKDGIWKDNLKESRESGRNSGIERQWARSSHPSVYRKKSLLGNTDWPCFVWSL